MILKSFDFQCDFDFQITTSKMIWILILNHLYLGDLILILKSSTYDDFPHLCSQVTDLEIPCSMLLKNAAPIQYWRIGSMLQQHATLYL